MKREVVVFDFDGTLTYRDSFLEFIAFAHGRWRLFGGFLLHSPWVAAYFLHVITNERLKQRLFAHFFQGMSYTAFCQLGQSFAGYIDRFMRPEVVAQLQRHVVQGHTVMVVSASIREWVLPWCERQGVEKVLATEVEVSPSGVLTGRFTTKNCYGPEKVARLLLVEPERQAYRLTAYGDSQGDREMMELADEKHWIRR